jgi:hypothetical protein
MAVTIRPMPAKAMVPSASWVRAEGLRPLEPPEAYKQVLQRGARLRRAQPPRTELAPRAQRRPDWAARELVKTKVPHPPARLPEHDNAAVPAARVVPGWSRDRRRCATGTGRSAMPRGGVA